MAEEKYTWDDIIINPHIKRAEDVVGRKCYFDNNPGNVLGRANYGDTVNILTLKKIEQNSAYPFIFDGVEGPVAFSCIVVKKEDPYSERAKKWIKENDLKVNDYVKVTRKAEIYEDGWDSLWNDSMTDYIGKALKVLAINSLRGLISLDCDDTVYDFPYFVLEKTEPLKPEYVPFSSKEEFIEAFHYHDNANYSEIEDILMNYGMWLKDKNSHEIFLVTGVFNQSIHICDFDSDESWGELLNEFTFIDGSPCGKLAEEEQ